MLTQQEIEELYKNPEIYLFLSNPPSISIYPDLKIVDNKILVIPPHIKKIIMYRWMMWDRYVFEKSDECVFEYIDI